MDESAALDVAERFIACLRDGDVDAMGVVYHDDLVVWRNFDDRHLSKDQALKVVRFLQEKTDDRAYDDVRVRATWDGFVQTHVLRCTAQDGSQVNAHTCLVVRVEGDQIIRLDEYIDGAQLAPLMR